jgi:hypothetical protein
VFSLIFLSYSISNIDRRKDGLVPLSPHPNDNPTPMIQMPLFWSRRRKISLFGFRLIHAVAILTTSPKFSCAFSDIFYDPRSGRKRAGKMTLVDFTC